MRVLGVCAGQGVIVYPLKRYLVGNIEPRPVFYTKGNIQWKLNFGSVPLVRSIGEFKEKDIDVIIGHPDCGHSSMLAYSRAKKLSDPLGNDSLNLYINSITKLKPKVFLMENLPKFLDSIGIERLENMLGNYRLVTHTGSVSDFGNSQKNRVRLIIVGIRKDIKDIDKVQYHFSQYYPVREIKTCDRLLSGLGDETGFNAHVREDIDEMITMYSGFKLRLSEAQEFWIKNKHLTRWPAIGRKFTTAPAVYRNRDKDYPATARKSNRQFNNDGLQMSPRELARIQGVPDRYKIHMDLDNKWYWINKGRTAVTKTPPFEIGLWFKKQIKKTTLWRN